MRTVNIGKPVYWVRFREMDGSWTDWYKCSEDYYCRVQGIHYFDTKMTYAQG